MGTVKAIDKVFLFRILKDTPTESAFKIAYQTDASTEESRSFDTEVTKDGNIKAAGSYEASHSLTSFLASDDTYIAELKELVRSGDGRLEVWDVDRTGINETGTNTINGDYSIDVVTSVSTSGGAEGSVEVTIETEVEGLIVAGEITVDEALKTLLTQIEDELTFVQPIVTGGE